MSDEFEIAWKNEIDDSVKNGIEFLDIHDPDWWKNGTTPNGINLEILDMKNSDYCVLGQRHSAENKCSKGAFWEAIRKFNITLAEATALGFAIDQFFQLSAWKTQMRIWDYLTEVWVEEIKKRRKNVQTND